MECGACCGNSALIRALQAVSGAHLRSGLQAQRGTQRAACRELQRLRETCVPVSIIIAWLALLPPPALPCRLLRRGVLQGWSFQALVCLLSQPAALLANPKERQRLVHVQGTLLGLKHVPQPGDLMSCAPFFCSVPHATYLLGWLRNLLSVTCADRLSVSWLFKEIWLPVF